jgi:hypothetical protein
MIIVFTEFSKMNIVHIETIEIIGNKLYNIHNI